MTSIRNAANLRDEAKTSAPRSVISTHIRISLVCLILVAGVLAVYSPVRHSDYIVCDDLAYVVDNPHVSNGLSAASIKWSFTTLHAANWHPLTWLSLMLDCQLWGPSARAIHVTSAALHALSAVLLFLVLKRLTNRMWPSALVAAIFALHPLHVESVAWASERKDVLSGFFFVVSLWCYARYTDRRTIVRYAMLLIAFALALLSKPMVVTLPFVLLLLDYWPLERTRRQSLRFLILEKLPLLALSVASSVITYIAQRHGGAVVSVAIYPLRYRIQNALISYARYLGKTIWPTNLAFFYPPVLKDYSALLTVVSVAVLIATTTAVVLAGPKRRYLPVGWFWFLGMLFPVIGIVQVGMQSMADRYVYLPLIGLSIMFAYGAADLMRSWNWRVTATGAAILIAACAALTWWQVQFWKDGLVLFDHALAVAPDNAFERNNLGAEHGRRNQLQSAIDQYRRAIQLDPTFVPAYIGIGRAHMLLGDYADAANAFETAQKLTSSTSALAESNLGVLAGLQNDPIAAILHFRRSLEIDPDQPEAEANLAMTLMKTGDLVSAERAMRHVLHTNPSGSDRHYELGLILVREHKLAEAESEFRRSLELNPRAPQVLYELATLELNSNRVPEAIATLNQAVACDNSYLPAVHALAWVLATNPAVPASDAPDALRWATRADEISHHRDPEVIDTLAAAHARSGDFAGAIALGNEARALAESGGDQSLTKQIAAHLKAFSQNQPVIEP